MNCSLASVCLLMASASPALSQDFFVDAVHGDDSNSGVSQQEAVRTITRASQLLSVWGRSDVLVQSGLYDAALGEQFPITLPEGTRIHGPTDGSPIPVLVPDPTHDGLILADGHHHTYRTWVRNLRFQDSRRAIVILAGSATISGVEVSVAAIGIDIQGPGVQVSDTVIVDSRIVFCDVGISSTATGTVDVHSKTSLGDCHVGVSIETGSRRRRAALDLRIELCGTGVRVHSIDGGGHVATSGLTARCDTGIEISSQTGAGPRWRGGFLTIADCDIGLNMLTTLKPGSTLKNSILSLNFSDAPLGLGGAVLSDSIVHSGSLTGAGVLAVDPMFVNASLQDFRLLSGSPAVDAGPTALAAVDGNLDSVGALDYGGLERLPLDVDRLFSFAAIPFFTLTHVRATRIGEVVDFEIRGDAGSFVQTLFTPQPSNSTQPAQTPFGLLLLDPSATQRLTRLTIPLGSNVVPFSITVPNDPTLIGLEFGFQALVESSLSPSGFALTNAAYLQLR